MPPSDEPSKDPLTEMDTLAWELGSLGGQLAERRISKEQFETMSSALRERLSRAESLAYVLARKNDDIAKRLRARSYVEPSVQQICGHFVSGSKKTLEPEFGADLVPRYYVEDEKGGRTPVERSLLERMVDVRILTGVLFEKLPCCPQCRTRTNVYSRFKCTQCGMIDISINRMLEHIQCGTIHQEREFQVGRNLICPSCKKLLQRPDEHRMIGLVCSCNKCGARFEDPVQSFYCRGCEVDFDLKTGIMTDIYIYSINEKVLNEIQSHLGIPAIAKLVERGEYEVSVPGPMAGKKEVQFSITARKGSRIIAIDVATSETEVDVGPVLELYVKLLEVTPTLAVFCAMPRLSSKARQVAESHKILVVEGSTSNEVAQGIMRAANSGASGQ